MRESEIGVESNRHGRFDHAASQSPKQAGKPPPDRWLAVANLQSPIYTSPLIFHRPYLPSAIEGLDIHAAVMGAWRAGGRGGLGPPQKKGAWVIFITKS